MAKTSSKHLGVTFVGSPFYTPTFKEGSLPIASIRKIEDQEMNWDAIGRYPELASNPLYDRMRKEGLSFITMAKEEDSCHVVGNAKLLRAKINSLDSHDTDRIVELLRQIRDALVMEATDTAVRKAGSPSSS